MRICLIGNASSVHVTTRASAFASNGHDVVLVSEKPAQATDVSIRAPNNRGLPGFRAFGMLRQLAKMLREESADIYHVHYATGYGAWLTAALGLKPLVVSVMGGDVLFDEQMPQTWMARWLTRKLVCGADLVTSKSAYLTKHLREMGVDPERILPVVWGVDLERFSRQDATALRKRLRISESSPVILSPRILLPLYNIDLIIAAFAEVLSDHPDAVLVVTGHRADEDYQHGLANQVEELGIAENVRFVGPVPPQEMPLFYSMAELSVGLASSDGMPQTMFEAMACGVPSVMTRLKRYEEFVKHGESAWLVDLEPRMIGAAISQLLADEPLRNRIAEAGRQIVATRADLTVEVARMDEALTALISRASEENPTPAQRPVDVGMVLAILIVAIEFGLNKFSSRFQDMKTKGRLA
ncbi:MAG: glycosyltransferase family 4 protein [Rhodospirillales bacterium]|nr:glycosyltransferase family 4 protein [Rhodospirillales bacterium]